MKLSAITGSAAMVSLALFGTATSAAPIILTPDADAFVNAGTAATRGTNYGTNTTLSIRGNSQYRSYIRYDLSSINGDVETASLTVTFTSFPTSATNFRLYALTDGSNTGEAWVEGNGGTDNSPEGELTWNNAPGIDSTSSFNHETTGGKTVNPVSPAFFIQQLSATPTSTNPTVTFSNIGIKNLLNADTNNLVTFIIGRIDGGSNILNIASKENATTSAHPALTVTVVPEPSAAALAALAGTGFLRRRRA
jgi:MYXO-CTERM domain-containing protein